jgi:hypothetical protein
VLEELEQIFGARKNSFGKTTAGDNRAPRDIPPDDVEFADRKRPRDDVSAPQQKVGRESDSPLDSDESMDVGSWIRYRRRFDTGDERQLNPMPNRETFTDDVRLELGEPAEVREAPGDAAKTAKEEASSSTTRTNLALAARIALAAVALVVIGLVILALLRSEEEEDEETEEGNGEEPPPALDPLAQTLATLDEKLPRDRVLSEYLRLQGALERTRNHRRPHQTPAEHARWVLRQRDDVEKPFLALHRVLYRLLYAGGTVDKHDVTQVVKSCRRLRRLLG